MNMFLVTAVPELGDAAVDAPITTLSAIDPVGAPANIASRSPVVGTPRKPCPV
jgi:hypothetical protein